MSTAKIIAFKRLITELIEIVQKHTEVDLSFIQSHIETAFSMSPSTTFSQFTKDAAPYLGEIRARNSHFFIDLASGENLLEVPIADVWGELDEAERNKIWENVEKMLVIAG